LPGTFGFNSHVKFAGVSVPGSSPCSAGPLASPPWQLAFLGKDLLGDFPADAYIRLAVQSRHSPELAVTRFPFAEAMHSRAESVNNGYERQHAIITHRRDYRPGLASHERETVLILAFLIHTCNRGSCPRWATLLKNNRHSHAGVTVSATPALHNQPGCNSRERRKETASASRHLSHRHADQRHDEVAYTTAQRTSIDGIITPETPDGIRPRLFSPGRRKIFSTPIIASSTTAPMAIARPPSVMVFIVTPNLSSQDDVLRRELGMAVTGNNAD